MSGFKGHPCGLYVLFATELWERYGFYSLNAILTLYMDEQLRFSQQLSGQVYGGYIGAVYFMPLFGGLLADRWLGYNRAVMAGAVLMGLGYLSLGAGTVPINDCNVVTFTATTATIDTINTCNAANLGRQLLALCNSSTQTFSESGNLRLGATTRACGAHDILTLVCNGTNWLEVAWAAN